MIKRQDLSSGWTLRCTTPAGRRPHLPDAIPASVPGCVHLDLMAADLIADPYLDLNEITTDWIGRRDWLYETRFEAQTKPGETIELVFEGLDTFAVICLNGTEISRTANMHRTYCFDITKHVVDGVNSLTILFENVYAHGERLEQHYGYRPNNYPGPGHMMRKMACNFGWDWGPTLVTAGIWKPVALVVRSAPRFQSLRVSAGLDGANGTVSIAWDLSGDAANCNSDSLEIAAEIDGVTHVFPALQTGKTRISVPHPQLWWPHHLGSQPLYTLTLALRNSRAGEILDTHSKTIAFRSVRLDTSADTYGSAFTFIINETEIFVCGANWIPDDCFPSRITQERYEKRIAQAKAANINMLRVWGGGIFERDEFYEACDRAGMLVWQDFLFACACYPEEEPQFSEVEAEVRDNVSRLMHHASLILWNGNNENIWGFADWGWKDALDGKTWGLGYYTGLLPRLCAELDPDRPYYAGSPYSGSDEIHPNDDHHGCKHVWDVWNDVGYEHYRDHVPRFCSEFGWQAPPSWATLASSVRDNPMSATSAGVFHHQKATIGNTKLLRGLAGHLPQPDSFEHWHFATQLNQAHAIRFGIEHFRSHRDVCKGAIVWQLNDCWPVTSWAAIDSGERLKPLWYALRDAFDPHLLTIQPRDAGLTLFAVNERTLPWRAKLVMKRMRLDGIVLAEATFWRLVCDRFEAKPYLLPPEIAQQEDPLNEVIVVTMLEKRALWFFTPDETLALKKPDFTLDIATQGHDTRVTITAKVLIKDLCLLADKIDPDLTVDTMLVTLLPGEQHVFTLTGHGRITEAEIRKPGVLLSANDLVVKA